MVESYLNEIGISYKGDQHFLYLDAHHQPFKLNRELIMNGFEVNQVMVKKHSLEEIFLSMTSEGGNTMKLVTLFWLELYKQKKGWIWLFLLIIPVGTTLAMFLDFSIRYDYLLNTAQTGIFFMGFVVIRKSPYPWLGDVFTDVYRNYLCLYFMK